MKNTNLILKLTLITLSMWAFQSSIAYAGDDKELKYEISFLAKKLLDKSGEDSITVEQEAFMKPFIGICSDVEQGGVRLTCITPGHSAQEAGLKTGDLITSINDVTMTGFDPYDHKSNYYKLVKKMKTGDKLDMTLIRGGKETKATVIVGALSHPAYTLTVKRK